MADPPMPSNGMSGGMFCVALASTAGHQDRVSLEVSHGEAGLGIDLP